MSTYVLLLCMVLLALEVPLAVSLTNRETQRMLADRLADATRFAALAAPALRSNDFDPIKDELRQYYELYGIASAVYDQDTTMKSDFGPRPGEERMTPAIRGALAGRQVGTPTTLWPWQEQPLIVAVPVNDEDGVLGTVVTISPTNRNRRAIISSWLELGLLGLLAVAACVVTALRLAGWVLRPVTRLDAAAHEIAAGDSGARVQPEHGPPELRRMSASFNEMADAVAEAFERQRSFVAHASHQLRNPLTVLRLRVEDLGTRLVDDDHARADHEITLAETDRLADVLDGLLALARAERGQKQVVVVDAVEVAQGRRLAWQPMTERRGIELVTLVPDQPLYARHMATALDQSLDALIDNALKFTPTGGRVEIEVATHDGGVQVTVRDNGCGMTDEQCQLATERFWRAPDAQNVDGAGLGLPIVMVLVEASGGRFTLGPAEPHGLEARMWFPAGPAPVPEPAPEAARVRV